MLAEVFDPLDRYVNVVVRQLHGAGTNKYSPFSTIRRVGSLGQPALALEMGYGPADGRNGNTSDPVKGGHAAGPSREVATEHLSNDAQLIERNFASKPVGQCL